MKALWLQRLALVACLAMADCKVPNQDEKGANPTPAVNVTCGTYDAGLEGGLVVAAVFDSPPDRDVPINVEGGGAVTCRAGKRVCIDVIPGVNTWTSDGHRYVAMFLHSGGLDRPAFVCHPFDAFPLPQPEGSAEAVAGKLEVTWKPVVDPATGEPVPLYAATLTNLTDLRSQQVLGRVPTSGTHATFDLPDGKVPELAVVEVEAWATDPDAFTDSEVPPGGANRSVRAIPVIGAPWAMRQPWEYAANQLGLPVAEGSRMAVILLNVQGEDHVHVDLQATGTTSAPRTGASPGAPPFDHVASVWRPAAGEAGPSGVAPPANGAAARAAASRTFCTPRWTSAAGAEPESYERRTATLVGVTALSLDYVDDEDVDLLSSGEWGVMVESWESALERAIRYSGTPADLGGEKFTLLFTRKIYPVSGWEVFDLDRPLDTSPDCSEGGGNEAYVLFLYPPVVSGQCSKPVAWANVASLLWAGAQIAIDDLEQTRKPSRVLTGDMIQARLSLMLSLGGAGYHLDAYRHTPLFPSCQGPAVSIFGRSHGPVRGYETLRLAPFEYVGASWDATDMLMLYLADRLGEDFVERFYREVFTIRELEVVSGLPFPLMYALWTGALLFSNEQASPWQGFDYLGEDWTPLHEKFMPFEYAPLEAGSSVTATLRQNGFDVYVTGVAGSGGGTVTVTVPDPQQMRPYVVVIPFQGELP